MTGTVNADGTSRPVRNLGWLLRHAAEVERLEFRAWLSHGRLFEGLALWRQWIERPRFSGLTAGDGRS